MTAIHLSDRYPKLIPLRRVRGTGSTSFPIWSCTGRGLHCRRSLLTARWALTPPFHPYPERRYILCGAFLTAEYSPQHPAFQPDFLPCGVRTFLPAEAERPSIKSAFINVIFEARCATCEERLSFFTEKKRIDHSHALFPFCGILFTRAYILG